LTPEALVDYEKHHGTLRKSLESDEIALKNFSLIPTAMQFASAAHSAANATAWADEVRRNLTSALAEPNPAPGVVKQFDVVAELPIHATNRKLSEKIFNEIRPKLMQNLVLGDSANRAELTAAWRNKLRTTQLAFFMGEPAFWDFLWLSVYDGDTAGTQTWLESLNPRFQEEIRDARLSLDVEKCLQEALALAPNLKEKIETAVSAMLALPAAHPSEK
jgi:hypothetical protein